MTVGERIKSTRLEKGIRQTELANAIGISKQQLCKYESDSVQNIPYETLEKIGKALSISPVYLLGWEQDLEAEKLVIEEQKESLKKKRKRLKQSVKRLKHWEDNLTIQEQSLNALEESLAEREKQLADDFDSLFHMKDLYYNISKAERVMVLSYLQQLRSNQSVEKQNSGTTPSHYRVQMKYPDGTWGPPKFDDGSLCDDIFDAKIFAEERKSVMEIYWLDCSTASDVFPIKFKPDFRVIEEYPSGWFTEDKDFLFY